MSANWGKNIELSLFGESHGKAIGIVIGNLPAGIKLDMDAINRDMKRRAPGQNKMSTARVEKDEVDIIIHGNAETVLRIYDKLYK